MCSSDVPEPNNYSGRHLSIYLRLSLTQARRDWLIHSVRSGYACLQRASSSHLPPECLSLTSCLSGWCVLWEAATPCDNLNSVETHLFWVSCSVNFCGNEALRMGTHLRTMRAVNNVCKGNPWSEPSSRQVVCLCDSVLTTVVGS